jgi:molybdopterin/thiamine biosynthesis adenylyltransferase
MGSLQAYLRERAEGDLLPWKTQEGASAQFGLPCGIIEEAALVLGLLPARYQRNRITISCRQQLQLFKSRVAVIGCGGLGGYLLEELARVGVGTIVAVDPDVFEEHNLNRQLLATPQSLGQPKVEAAADRIAAINPAVTVVAHRTAYAPDNGHELLRGVTVVVDALDSIPTRLALAETCSKMGIPLVHGAIGGWYGQVATQFPGDQTLQRLYGHVSTTKGVEQQLGNPSFTPAVVASIQAAETVKVLLGAGTPLRQRHLMIDLLDMSFEEINHGVPE